ncbi:MAG: hypothetical protein GY820_31310 [Gammaproteobacteria bacterium]|nr:hypothetical protein [Gammaproteobacteria bacterium]
MVSCSCVFHCALTYQVAQLKEQLRQAKMACQNSPPTVEKATQWEKGLNSKDEEVPNCEKRAVGKMEIPPLATS